MTYLLEVSHQAERAINVKARVHQGPKLVIFGADGASVLQWVVDFLSFWASLPELEPQNPCPGGNHTLNPDFRATIDNFGVQRPNITNIDPEI